MAALQLSQTREMISLRHINGLYIPTSSCGISCLHLRNRRRQRPSTPGLTQSRIYKEPGVLSDGTCHTPARQVPFLRWLHFSTHLPQDTPEYYTGKSAQARVQWDFAVEGNPWCKLRPISKLLRRRKQYGFKNIIPVSSKIDCQFFLKNNWDNDIVKLIFQNWTSFPVSVYSFTPHELTLVTSLQLTLVTSWNRHWWHHYNIITFTGRHPLIKHTPTRNHLLRTWSHTWATAPAWI